MSKFKSIDKLNKEHFITLRFTDEEYAMIDFKNTLNLKNFYANPRRIVGQAVAQN